jgi:hypothetical protein
MRAHYGMSVIDEFNLAEVWRQIPKCERYEVSSLGTVRHVVNGRHLLGQKFPHLNERATDA